MLVPKFYAENLIFIDLSKRLFKEEKHLEKIFHNSI